MPSVELREEERRPGQRVERVSLEEDRVALEGPSLAIRFPATWARKLLAWADGPGRNILCTADLRRYNLVGVTRGAGDLTLSYVDEDGELRAERTSPGFLRPLGELLKGL